MGCGCGKSKFKDKVAAKLTQQPQQSQQPQQPQQSQQPIQPSQSKQIPQIPQIPKTSITQSPPITRAERILLRQERIKKREERIARRQRAERIRAIKQKRENQSKQNPV